MKLVHVFLFASCSLCLVLSARADGENDSKKTEVYSAAVLPFQERGSEVRGLGAQVTDLMFVNLAANPQLLLVDREDLQKTLQEQAMNLSGMIKPAEATRVGQLTGAKILVTGSVMQVSNKLYLVAKIIGTETSRVLGASASGNPRDNLDRLAKDLAEQVAKTIGERAGDLVAAPQSAEDRLAAMKKALGNAKRPVVAVEFPDLHLPTTTSTADATIVVERERVRASIGVGSARPSRTPLDPATETEVERICKGLGFEVIDIGTGNRRDADILLVGEGFSEPAARFGHLVSVKAHLELKAIEQASGKIVAADRQTTVVVDLTEQIAGKAALQEAAADILERLLPKIVKPATEKATGKTEE